MSESLTSKVDRLIQEVQNIHRRIDAVVKKEDSLQRSLDILDADRVLMENNHATLREIKDLIDSTRNKQTDARKESQTEIQEVKESIDDLPKEIGKAFDKGFKGVIETVKHDRTIRIKLPWYKRWLTRQS